MIFPNLTLPRRQKTISAEPRKRNGTQTGHRWPVAILGVPIDPVTMDEALDRIDAMVRSGRPHYVVTPNVDFLVQARRDAELHRILLEADLVLCDGQPLVWASRWLGNSLPGRVAGADLAPRLIARAEQKGYRLFLLGATPEANARAVARLRDSHPGLVVAGHYSPPFRPLTETDQAEIARRIREARPDILFVSFGCPKQEKWIARHYRALGVPVALGMGATIDFLAGQVRRAPVWMRGAGLEWLFRLAQEPRRLFRRYATNLRCFGGAIFVQCWLMRRAARRCKPGSAVAFFETGRAWRRVKVSGALDRSAIERAAGVWQQLGADDHDCLLDLRTVDFIDSTGAAVLARRWKQLHAAGHRLVLQSPSQAVRRALARLSLLDCFEIVGATPPAGPVSSKAA